MAGEMANSQSGETTSDHLEEATSPRPTIPPALLQELINQQVSNIQTLAHRDNVTTLPQYNLQFEDILHWNEVTHEDYQNQKIASDKIYSTNNLVEKNYLSSENSQATESSLFYTEAFQNYEISTMRNIPGFTNVNQNSNDSSSQTTGPSYTLTPMTMVDARDKFPYSTVSTNSETNTPTASTILVSHAVDEDFYVSERYPEFVTYQQVAEASTRDSLVIETVSGPNSQIKINGISNSIDKLPENYNNILMDKQGLPAYLYNYDYYPDLVLTNVLPPDQMAGDAFKEDMNSFKDHQKQDEYDYYGENIYLDKETQVNMITTGRTFTGIKRHR